MSTDSNSGEEKMAKGDRKSSATRRKTIALAGAGLTTLTGCTRALRKVATKGDDVVRKGDEVAQYGDEAGKSDEAAQSGDNVADKAVKKVGDKAVKKEGGDMVSDYLETTEASNTVSTTTSPRETTSTFSFPLIVFSDEISIEEGYYIYWHLDFASRASDEAITAEFSYTAYVNNGPAVDLLLIPEYEFSNFDNGREFRYYPDASSPDSRFAMKSGQLSLSSYYLIVDNTNRGSITEGGTAEVSIEFESTEVK